MTKYLSALYVLLAVLSFVPKSLAHCDSVGGPLIADARVALQRGDVAPVLKWVSAVDEPEVRRAFARAVAVRTQSAEASKLGEDFFFETVVRLHRAAEGAPYTGLKSAEAAEAPSIRAVDSSLHSGDSAALIEHTVSLVRRELTERIARATSARKQADTSVEAGRAYVRAYVELVHYVEALHGSSESETANAQSAPVSPAAHAHQH